MSVNTNYLTNHHYFETKEETDEFLFNLGMYSGLMLYPRAYGVYNERGVSIATVFYEEEKDMKWHIVTQKKKV